jgi:hypothetical protein
MTATDASYITSTGKHYHAQQGPIFKQLDCCTHSSPDHFFFYLEKKEMKKNTKQDIYL